MRKSALRVLQQVRGASFDAGVVRQFQRGAGNGPLGLDQPLLAGNRGIQALGRGQIAVDRGLFFGRQVAVFGGGQVGQLTGSRNGPRLRCRSARSALFI